MITPYNVLRHELVGLKAKIAAARHKGYEDISGAIVDETRNTIAIRQKDKHKKIPKGSATFEFALDEGALVRVDGTLLLARPEERIKKKIRIKFN
ncbi:MAG: ribonuclease P protein component 1 [Candidatus Altiarchaeota archaeon]